MLIHITYHTNCQHNYDTTDEVYALEDIVATFDHYKNDRWFKVKYEGYELEWER